jgi:FAD:protein FMN transferase
MTRAPCALLLASSVALAEAPLQRFAFEKAEMGIPFRITIYARDQSAAKAAVDAAFARIAELNSVFSDYEPESELSRLSRTSGTGRPVSLSPELWLVLEQARALAEKTSGAFDPTVGPLVNLWRRVRRKDELPSAELLSEMKARVGWRNLVLDREKRTARLLSPDMRLDLGAIAKGYAIDAALRILVDRGIAHALVTGAGDMAAAEPPPGEKAWKIELAPLDVPGAPPAETILLKRGALATSGDLHQYAEIDGRRYSHIVDPRTGLGLTDRSLVNVLARDAVTADSLSTAISVLGPEAGLQLAEETPGAAARIVRRPHEQVELHHSSRWPKEPSR